MSAGRAPAPPRLGRLAAVVAATVLVAACGGSGEEYPAVTRQAAPAATSVPDLSESLGAPTSPEGLTADARENELALRCADGLYAWCDYLFAQLEPTSPVAQYAATCGGRIQPPAEGASPNCRLRSASSASTPATSRGLGDDPDLDALALRCQEGSLERCDELWLTAEPASDYAEYGATCGGRSVDPRPNTCLGLLGIPAGVAPEALGEDAALDALALQCFRGRLESCEELYRKADVFSAYRPYAATCGGRLAAPSEAAVPPCRRRFADPLALGEPAAPEQVQDDTELVEDEVLGALADACFDADMAACDELYARAPRTTDAELYGATCGLRFQDSAAGLHFVAPGECEAFVTALPGDDPATDLT